MSSSKKVPTNVVDLNTDDVGIVEGRTWPLIKEGTYEAIFLHHETAVAFGVPRVYLHFKIITPGQYNGKVLYRAYRVKSLTGKPRKRGGFKVKPRGDYVREMAILLNPNRLDRITPQALKNKVFKIKVEEVRKDYKQRSIPNILRYSVIRELVSVDVGA